jgi:hypothetical protein
MLGETVQDREYYARGLVARKIGASFDAYRPTGSSNPLGDAYRYMKLYAAFELANGGFKKANTYGDAGWYGLFDASYTQPGDYLVAGDRVLFIASQQPLLPVLCIQTNRVVDVMRPALQTNVGTNAYGGYTSNGSSVLAAGWPASVLGIGGGGTSGTGLPTDQSMPAFIVLMPKVPTVIFSPGDIMNDDLGRTIVIASTELTDLGWRLSARLAST